MKNKTQNIEEVLSNKPELAFIIGVLGKNYFDFFNILNKAKSITLAHIINGEINCKQFIRLIKHHRLDSIFYKAVIEQNIKLPSKLLDELEHINKLNKMRMMKLTAELIRIHKLFTENNIDYISLKGPAVSQQIYGDFTIRSSRDLDILVRVKDLDKVNLLLNDINFFTAVKNFKKHEKAHHDIEFFNKEKNVKLEIHTRLFSFNKMFDYDNDTLFNKKDSVIINDINIACLNIKTNYNYLYIHAKNHSWELLYWIVDLMKLNNNTAKNKELVLSFITNNQNNKRENRLSYFLYLLSVKNNIKYKYSVVSVHFFRFINWLKKRI